MNITTLLPRMKITGVAVRLGRNVKNAKRYIEMSILLPDVMFGEAKSVLRYPVDNSSV